MRPVNVVVQKSKRLVKITWDDGQVQTIAFDALRRNCPCATCQALDPTRVLNDAAMDLLDVQSTGNYALRFTWGDGHRDGIYTWQTLRSLSGQS